MTHRIARVPIALLVALAALLALGAGSARANAGAVRLGTTTPLPQGARLAGTAPRGEELHLIVALEPQDPAGLERFAEEVSTPGSPNYGDHLSVAEFTRRFGATEAQVQAVRKALTERGLQVGEAGLNRLSLPVSTTVAGAEAAFGISMQRVETTSGRIAHRNNRAPAIPAAVAPYVQGVIGLDDVVLPHRQADASPPSSPRGAGVRGAPAASTAAAAVTPCAEALKAQQAYQAAFEEEEAESGVYTGETLYRPDQIASAYGFSDLYAQGDLGAGQTVALLELEPFNHENVARYQRCYGTQVPIFEENIEGGPEGEHETGEAGLDIEQLIGLAPGAKIVVYQAPNVTGGQAAILARWVEQDSAAVMSSSWGECEAFSAALEVAHNNTLLQEAAVQGQSFFVAAGDAGSTDCFEEPDKEEAEEGLEGDTELAVDSPGSSPFATSVGGTRLQSLGPPSTEYLWNDGSSAGGGGLSSVYPMPTYQTGAAPGLGVIGPLSGADPCRGATGLCRQVPDVSAEGSPDTGYLVLTEEEEEVGEEVKFTSAWSPIGGTSAAAPLWAALATLTNALPACGGHRIGFANPALYGIAGDAYATDLHDVIGGRPGGPQSNNRFGEPFYPATAGYDMATGLGTPAGAALASSLCALANPAPTPPPSPAPESSPAPTPSPAPQATPAAAGPKVRHATLRAVGGKGARVVFGLTARSGAELRKVKVRLPRGFVVAHTRRALHRGVDVLAPGPRLLPAKTWARGRTITIVLRKQVAVARIRLTAPAIRVTPGLAAWVRRHRAHKLKVVVVSREGAGRGARFELGLRSSARSRSVRSTSHRRAA